MRVAYVVSAFPVTSQTFVCQEIRDHIEAGLDVEVLVLRGQKDRAFPPEEVHPKLTGKVHYLSYPLRRYEQIKAIVGQGLTHPTAIPSGVKAMKWRKSGEVYMAMAMSAEPKSYDMVHAHFGNMGVMAGAMRTLKLLQGPLVVTIHGFDLSRTGFSADANDYMDRLATGADALLPVNTIWRDQLIASGCPPEKIRVHHMGVDLAAIDRYRFGTRNGDRFTLSSVGRFVEKKGHSYLIRAIRRAIDMSPQIKLSVNLVGEGPLILASKALVSELGLQETVLFAGSLRHHDALAVVANSDAFILPSVTARDGNMEGIPVSLMEAMALRKPVVSTRHSGIPELVESGVEGLLVQERDVEGLAGAIIALASDRDFAGKLAAAGRVKVEQQFDARTLGATLREFYGEVIKGYHAHRHH